MCPFEKVCFETGLEGGERVNIVNVLREKVQVGGRTTKVSRPHGRQAGKWCSKLDGRSGSESAGV